MNRQQLIEQSEAYLRDLLSRSLPDKTRVYLFGSRARGDARWNSDIDLWIDAEIAPALLSYLDEVLDESFVPFHVDIVATPQLTGRFGELVRKEAKSWM